MNVEYENFDKAIEAMLKSHKPEDSILYVINGDNVIRQLKLQEGKTTIPYDEFKLAVLRENCISQSIAQRIKLFTPNFFNIIKGTKNIYLILSTTITKKSIYHYRYSIPNYYPFLYILHFFF